MTKNLESIVIEPRRPADAVIVWLHGLGADGHDFESIVPELNLPAGMNVRFIFPHAPYRPITINRGQVMRGWYDIHNLSSLRQEDEVGIREARAMMTRLIEEQITRGIAARRIVLAGFSQGCALALYTGLRFPQRLAGLVGLSGYVPLMAAMSEEADPANRDLPLLLAHGALDEVVPLRLGEASRSALEIMGFQPEWHVYPMGHSVCMEEVVEVGAFLRRVLS